MPQALESLRLLLRSPAAHKIESLKPQTSQPTSSQPICGHRADLLRHLLPGRREQRERAEEKEVAAFL